MPESNSTLAMLTGSTGANPATPTTPVLDSGIRAAIALVVNAIAAGICKALDLSDTDTAQVLAVVTPILIVLFGVWDKLVAPKL